MKEKVIHLSLRDADGKEHDWTLIIDKSSVSLSGGMCPPESGFSLITEHARKLAYAILDNTYGR